MAGKARALARDPTCLFITGTVLGLIGAFSRADYNLPLFAFLTVMWNQDDVSSSYILTLQNEKVLINLLLVIATTVDVFWLLFWIPYYNSREMERLNYGLHMMVAVTAMLEIALKVIIFLFLFGTKGNNRRGAG